MPLFPWLAKSRRAPAPSSPAEVTAAAARVSAALQHLMSTNPKLLASPHARVVLQSDGCVDVAVDPRTPGRLLGPKEAGVIMLQANSVALERWVTELHADTTPVFQKMATDEFATGLVRALLASAATRG